MVEDSTYVHATFKAEPPPVTLNSLAPFLSSDVTSPDDFYSMLSQARQRRTSLTSSLNVDLCDAGCLSSWHGLPLKRRPISEQSRQDSYSRRKFRENGFQHVSMQRSTSLHHIPSLLSEKLSLKAALCTNIKKMSSGQKVKVSGKFGHQQDVPHCVPKDSPLLSIQGGIPADSGDINETSSNIYPAHSSDLHVSSRLSLESSVQDGDGKIAKIRKTVTHAPTIYNHPKVYWELRSPTVQDSDGGKVEKVYHDRYRLKQISSLRLRVTNREAMGSKLNPFRKWEQRLQEIHSPSLESPARKASSRVLPQKCVVPSGANSNGSEDAADKSLNGQKMSLSTQSYNLAIEAKSIQPSVSPPQKKGEKKSKSAQTEDSSQCSEEVVTKSELGQPENSRVKISHDEGEAKPQKASVVNLCIDNSDPKSNCYASDTYKGIRKVVLITHPQSDKISTQICDENESQNQGSQDGQSQDCENIPLPVSQSSGLCSVTSKGTIESPSCRNEQREPVPSAPAGNSSLRNAAKEISAEPNGPKKLIFKKFTRLQVFSERTTAVENSSDRPFPCSPCDIVQAKAISQKPVRLSQYRPPIYKLDMRNYPPYRYSSASLPVTTESAICLTGCGGYPLLANGRDGLPSLFSSARNSEAAALSFTFRNGEVIVSRQGNKPKVSRGHNNH